MFLYLVYIYKCIYIYIYIVYVTAELTLKGDFSVKCGKCSMKSLAKNVYLQYNAMYPAEHVWKMYLLTCN
jgi:hypothetical protein